MNEGLVPGSHRALTSPIDSHLAAMLDCLRSRERSRERYHPRGTLTTKRYEVRPRPRGVSRIRAMREPKGAQLRPTALWRQSAAMASLPGSAGNGVGVAKTAPMHLDGCTAAPGN